MSCKFEFTKAMLEILKSGNNYIWFADYLGPWQAAAPSLWSSVFHLNQMLSV